MICAFGPFPGVPVNPSARLARDLVRARRPALAACDLRLEILPTLWASLPVLADLIARHRPDGMLLFGIAPRRRRLSIETRAVNAAADRPDSAGRHPPRRRIDASAPAVLKSPARIPHLVAAARAACPAAPSRDAGRYLCNASYFIALARTGDAIPVVFVHVPGRPHRHGAALGLALRVLLRAFAAQVRPGTGA
ncbi:peptidase C15 [Xanthobacter sp. V4C-4]|uniref:pyroglutamyl-peptidase I family protein n=1 Tax=Xanthobacter cornucopiae TaxID=3119924 RepID=UPI00372B2B29